jgi:hypothetical protein
MKKVLSEEQIQRIQTEESIRLEIRKSLQEPESSGEAQKSKVWDFLNSSFGLWLLSTIFVTAMGTVYTQWQADRKDRQHKAEALQLQDAKAAELTWIESQRMRATFKRAALEVSQRYSNTLTRLYRLNNRGAGTVQAATPEEIRIAFAPLSETPNSLKTSALYPEYSTFNALALIAELQKQTDKPGDALLLKRHLTRTHKVLNEVALLAVPDDPKRLAISLVSAMRSSFWDNGFTFTECEPQNPFSC